MPNAERSAFALRPSAFGIRHSALSETRMKLTHVIRRPLLTEKTANLKEDRQTVVFEVAAGATKVDIKRAVEQLLGAKVANVRTALVHGKIKRQGRFAGRRPDWKKAYVRLRDGEKMPEFLEGA
jgi:large subunit ribosomal protein L23